MRTTSRTTRAVILAATSLLALSACGGEDNAAGSSAVADQGNEWLLVDYLRWNRSHAEINSFRESRGERGQKGAHKRWHVPNRKADPNCPYCNMFWKQARPWVESGKVQLRHIMVGMLRADSAGKSAALLNASKPEAALNEHEAAGKASKLKPLEKIPAALENGRWG